MSARGLVLITAVSTLLFATAPPASASPQYPTLGPAAATCSQETAKQWARNDAEPMLLCVYAPYPPAVFVIDRGGKKVDGVGGQELKNGDVVQAPDCGSHPDVRAEILSSDKVVELRCGDPQFSIEAPAIHAPTIWDAIRVAVFSAIAKIEGDSYTEHHIAAQSRGAGSAPLHCDLLTDPQTIPLGEAAVIPWGGGRAPYAVTVTGPSGAMIKDEQTNASQMPIDFRHARAGRYAVSIRDATGNRCAGSVALEHMNAEGTQRQTAAAMTDPGMRAVWYASSLIDRGDSYQLYAYQQLLPYEHVSAPAALLAGRLRGDI